MMRAPVSTLLGAFALAALPLAANAILIEPAVPAAASRGPASSWPLADAGRAGIRSPRISLDGGTGFLLIARRISGGLEQHGRAELADGEKAAALTRVNFAVPSRMS